MFWPDAAATLAVVRPGVAVALEHLEARPRGCAPARRTRAAPARAPARGSAALAQAGAPAAPGAIPIAASFFDSDFIAYSNTSLEW